MKAYSVCFWKYNDNHEIAFHYFQKIEKAQQYLIEKAQQYLRYKNDLIVWNKCESGLWSFKISLKSFYQDNSFADKFDRWFIDEIEVE